MSFLRRRPLTYSPPPAEVLSAAELARVARFKQVYAVAATFDLDCLADAARLVDRMEFVRSLIAVGRMGKGDRQ